MTISFYPMDDIDPIDLNTHTAHRFHKIRRIKFDVPRALVDDVRERYLMERLPGKEIYNIFRYDPKSGIIHYLYRYDNAQAALDALNRLNGTMNVEELRGELKHAFHAYINEENWKNVDNFIFSVMSIVMPLNDQYFQHLMDSHNLFIKELSQDHTKSKYFTRWELFQDLKCLNPMAEKFERCYDYIVAVWQEEEKKRIKGCPDLDGFAETIFGIFDIDIS